MIEQRLLGYSLPSETVAAIMILYKITKVNIHSPDGNRTIDIAAGVLSWKIFALPTSAESKVHSLEQAADGIDLNVNADETDYMCFNKIRNISTLNSGSLKLVDHFTNLGSYFHLQKMTSIRDYRRHGLLTIGCRRY